MHTLSIFRGVKPSDINYLRTALVNCNFHTENQSDIKPANKTSLQQYSGWKFWSLSKWKEPYKKIGSKKPHVQSKLNNGYRRN